MKTIIMFLLSAVCLFSQTLEPTQHQFLIKGTPTYISSELEYFRIDRPLIGWNWGGQHKITKALLCNQGEFHSSYGKHLIPDNVDVFLHSQIDSTAIGVFYAFHSHVYYDNSAIFSKSMCFDPTLYVDPSDVHRLNIRAGDSQNPVF